MKLYSSLRVLSILAMLVTFIPKIYSSQYVFQTGNKESKSKVVVHFDHELLPTATPYAALLPTMTPTPTVTPSPIPTITLTPTPLPPPDYSCAKIGWDFEYYKYTGSIDNTIVNENDLFLPIEYRYVPGWIRGYFESHPAIDIVFTKGFNEGVPIFPPHANSQLVATAIGVKGKVSDNINMSGTIEFYYLNIKRGNEVTPYLFAYSHLSTGSMLQAMEEAKLNNGRVTIAGEIGNTGWGDGWHLHVNIINLAKLYELTETNNIRHAIDALLNAPDNSYLNAYEDPLNFYVNATNLNFISGTEYDNIQKKDYPKRLPNRFPIRTINKCQN